MEDVKEPTYKGIDFDLSKDVIASNYKDNAKIERGYLKGALLYAQQGTYSFDKGNLSRDIEDNGSVLEKVSLEKDKDAFRGFFS